MTVSDLSVPTHATQDGQTALCSITRIVEVPGRLSVSIPELTCNRCLLMSMRLALQVANEATARMAQLESAADKGRM
jgi:hypothetical protein